MKEIAQGQSFENFYNREYIYIDKTKEISSLLKYERVFFSRPRRFGKSTVLDTIATLFESGVEPYFKDTWIYDKWTEKTYPVLRLNFLEFSVTSFDEFVNSFNNKLASFAKKNNLADFVVQNTIYDSVVSLFEALGKQSIVILIDEYDCQLTANINNLEFYNKFQESMRDFYAEIKGKNVIKFLGITGVTRLKDVSIFSVGSDIIDVSYYSDLATLIGFTREEIKEYYIEYINLTASIQNNISLELVTEEQREEVLDRLALEYNGYCFDESYTKKVFSTWSVNQFFTLVKNKKNVNYGDYWYGNGGLPSILKNYLESRNLNNIQDYNKDFIVVGNDNFLNPTSLLTMDQNVLMCQTGYLTLRSPLTVGLDVNLGIPNYEVKRALNRLYCLKITNNKYSINYESLNQLEQGNAADIFNFFNAYLRTISYEKYPITSESVLRGYLHIILLCYRVNISVEVQNSKGRSDMQLELDNRRIVLELKFVKDSREVQEKLAEAVAQIKTRDYGNTLPLKSDLLRIAMVFDANIKEFVAFESV